MGNPFIELSIFPVLCKWREAVAVVILSTWVISFTFWCESCSTKACNCSLSRLHNRPLPSSSLMLSSTPQNFCNHLRNVHLWTVYHHKLLILAEYSEVLCSSDYLCNINKRRSFIVISTVEDIYASKIFFLKMHKNYYRTHYVYQIIHKIS